MVFPAPFEDLGPQLNVAGSSSVIKATLQVAPLPFRSSGLRRHLAYQISAMLSQQEVMHGCMYLSRLFDLW